MRVIDSHTGGEPTRVILDGGPDLGSGSLADRAKRLARDHINFCKATLLEPRGQPAMVGALLVEPEDNKCLTGVIYFDAAAVLGMCGHGTIGLMVTLAHMGLAASGSHLIETPAGLIDVQLNEDGAVVVTNVESHVLRNDLTVEVDNLGDVTGSIAYGGNTFFIVEPSPIAVAPENIPALSSAAIALRTAVNTLLTRQNSPDLVDHVIFQAASDTPGVFSRNFVLCPDDAYDRSPCGTGSSAYLALLAAQQRLKPGQEIVQESIIGSSYRLSYAIAPSGGIIPSIQGTAYIMAEKTLIFPPSDPFRFGIPT